MDEEITQMFGINSEWPELGRRSISTEMVHRWPQQYIAELLMIHENPELANKPYFWRDRKHSIRYMSKLVEAKKRIKTAGFKAVHNAVLKHKLTRLINNDDKIAEEILNG